MRITINRKLCRGLRLVVLGSAALMLANCASTPHPRANAMDLRPAPGSAFVVDVIRGDTLSEIAVRYRVHMEDIVAINGLYDVDRLLPGQRLYVPAYGLGSNDPAPRRVAQASRPRQVSTQRSNNNARSQAVRPAPRPATIPASRPSDTRTASSTNVRFLWPVDGPVLSSFGQSPNGQRNDGINIAAPRGTPIRAAEGGTVSYVGNELKGYGNLLLIRHDNGFVTAYAHADRILVARGDRVDRGQLVGYSGATGDVTQPQLHFEIRRGTRPVNPTAYLGAANATQASLVPSSPARS